MPPLFEIQKGLIMKMRRIKGDSKLSILRYFFSFVYVVSISINSAFESELFT